MIGITAAQQFLFYQSTLSNLTKRIIATFACNSYRFGCNNMQKRFCGAATIFAFALSISSAASEGFCRPRLEINPFRPISGVFPQERVWKADLTGDASQCREESGLFQLQITRLKENALDLDFLVTEVWRAGQFEVELTTANDEAIGLTQIMWISRCSCAPHIVASGQK